MKREKAKQEEQGEEVIYTQLKTELERVKQISKLEKMKSKIATGRKKLRFDVFEWMSNMLNCNVKTKT